MPVREGRADRGRRQATRLRVAIGRELRDARELAGLSQAHAGRLSGLSQPKVSRIEWARDRSVDVEGLAVLAAVLGLRLSLQVFPEGSPARDRAHLALLARFREHVGAQWSWASEVPVASRGDLRAWDGVLTGAARIAVDAETRLTDVQALQRREELKLRDGSVDRLLLLVSPTRHNLAVLREHREALRSTFPLDTAGVLPSLRGGRDPGANGVVLVPPAGRPAAAGTSP
jgi:transcriptional regulator with XRE-family HTH domain